MKKRAVIFFVCALLLLPCGAATAQNERAITLITQAVEFVFQPPAKISVNSKHRLNTEIPRVNLTVNLIENYLQYLIYLKKISANTKIKLIYSPQAANEGTKDFGSDFITISELGLNGILTKINSRLKRFKSTDTTALLDSGDALFSISDKYLRLNSKPVDKLKLTNLSLMPKSLEPDSDFAVIGSESAVITRPYSRSNRLFKISKNQEGQYQTKLLLGQAKDWYDNLTPSPNGDYLAFTDGGKPLVMHKNSAGAIFGNSAVVLLKMAWAPTKPYLAGMVINSETQNRQFFIYDAKENKLIDCGSSEIEAQANYFDAMPLWSPDSSKIIMTSSDALHIILVNKQSCVLNALRLNGSPAELMWAPSSKAFAFVETEGQARNQYNFDDLDYKKSVLRGFSIDENGVIAEDQAQKTTSRNTIKLVGFYNSEQLLYLEGHLMAQRLPMPVWQLHNSFSAYLTPKKPKDLSRAGSDDICITKIRLPIQYLFVYKNLDSKYRNIYDSGFRHTNYAHVKDFNNLWLIGLKKPIGMPIQNPSFNNRRFPYPFQESNTCMFSSVPHQTIKNLMKFLEEYDIRSCVFSSNAQKLFMLANFEGPLNLYCADKNDFLEALSGE